VYSFVSRATYQGKVGRSDITTRLGSGRLLLVPAPNETNNARIMLRAMMILRTIKIFSEVDLLLFRARLLAIYLTSPCNT
jgi:hypothetical protein